MVDLMTLATPTRSRFLWRLAASAVLLSLVSLAAHAQELEPRAYRTLPTGLNFAALAYSFSSGNIVADATSPVQDLELDASIASLGYLRSVGIFGRSGSVSVQVPYVFLSGTARVADEPVSGTRTGFADTRLRLSVNLLGGPALPPAEFARYQQRRNLGVSLTVAAPTGEYKSSQLVNLGANRWSLKPEVGYSSIKGRWIIEAAAGVWFFTSNDRYNGDSTLRQDPIPSLQGHVSYNFNRRVWLAVDGNWYSGGQTSIDGQDQPTAQSNSRLGLTLSFAFARLQSIKLSAHSGAFTRAGADFDVASIAYQYGWGKAMRAGR
jgi:hypothetical protein